MQNFFRLFDKVRWQRFKSPVNCEESLVQLMNGGPMPEQPTDNVDWLSTPAAAKRLGITPRTLYRFIDEGHVTAYKFGRVIRLKKDDVDVFIEECRVTPGTMKHLYPTP